MLKLLETREALLDWRKTHPDLGFVPTMGNLHPGHLSLVEKSFENHSSTLISIFVNPTQFNSPEDLKNYPRTLAEDLSLLEKLKTHHPMKELAVFIPINSSEVYPQSFDTQILPGKLADKLCGFYRPGHFSGVCSVVYCLLNLAQAKAAYFGKKDYQQFLIVQKMVEDLNLKTKIIPCDLIREENGLALSSRNNRLTADQKIEGLKLFHSLKKLESYLMLDNIELMETERLELLKNDKGFEYLEVLDAKNLEAISLETKNFILAGAYFVGAVRLIDNLLISKGLVPHA